MTALHPLYDLEGAVKEAKLEKKIKTQEVLKLDFFS